MMKMTAENNRKYIAEAWIENGKEEEFKKSFLNALIEQWQGHRDDGSGLDADKLDGHHYSEIEEEIEDIQNRMITTFEIGFQQIIPSDPDDIKRYKLGFEAIQLFLPGKDGYSNEDLELPWENRAVPYKETEIPTLHDAFRLLYEEIKNTMVSVEKYNEEFYNPFYKEDGYIEKLDKISSALHNIDNNGNINAQTINGLRFYVVTQTQYDEMKQNYPDKVNNIHNIFIIKSEEDLAANGYDDYIYDGNPDIATPDRYYRFRVADIKIEEGVYEKWLQYCYDSLPDDEAHWKDMCKANDFIDLEYLKSQIKPEVLNILPNDATYVLNRTSFLNTIREIKEDDNNPIDIIGFDYFIKGAYYTENDVKKDIPSRRDSNDKYNLLDFTDFNTRVSEKINNVSTSLNEYKLRLEGENQQGGVIGTLRGGVNGNKTDITDLKSRVGRIESLLENIETNLNSIREDVTNATKVELYYLGGLRRPKDNSNQTISKRIREKYLDVGKNLPSNIDSLAPNGWLVTSIRYNREIKIATLYVSFYHYHLKENAGKWVEPSYQFGKTYKKWKDLSVNFYSKNAGAYVSTPGGLNNYQETSIPEYLCPTSSVYFDGVDSKRHIRIDPETGKISVLVDYTKDMHLNFFGQVTYRMRNVQDPVDNDNEN